MAPALPALHLQQKLPNSSDSMRPRAAIIVSVICLAAGICFLVYFVGKWRSQRSSSRAGPALPDAADKPFRYALKHVGVHVPQSAMNPAFEYSIPRHLALLPASLTWVDGTLSSSTRINLSLLHPLRATRAEGNSSPTLLPQSQKTAEQLSCHSLPIARDIKLTGRDELDCGLAEKAATAPILSSGHVETPGRVSLLLARYAGRLHLFDCRTCTDALAPYSVATKNSAECMHDDGRSASVSLQTALSQEPAGKGYVSNSCSLGTGNNETVVSSGCGSARVNWAPAAEHPPHMHGREALCSSHQVAVSDDWLRFPGPPMPDENIELPKTSDHCDDALCEDFRLACSATAGMFAMHMVKVMHTCM